MSREKSAANNMIDWPLVESRAARGETMQAIEEDGSRSCRLGCPMCHEDRLRRRREQHFRHLKSIFRRVTNEELIEMTKRETHLTP